MNPHRRTRLLCLLVFSLTLLSCATPVPFFGPTPTITPTSTPPATSTPIPTSTPQPTPTLIPFVIQDAKFQDYQQDCNTDVNITGVQGTSLEISVNTTITMLNGGWAVFCYGAKHTWIGTLEYAGYTFASDASDPLQFMVEPDGYHYIGGTGVVTSPDGRTTSLGSGAGPAANNPGTSQAFDKPYFSDSFDDDSNDWSTGNVDGDWWVGTRLVQDGVLDWNGTSRKGMSSFVAPGNPSLQDNLTDVQVSAKVKLLNPSMQGFFGITLRGDPQNDYYYIFAIDYAGDYSFMLRSNDQWTTLVDWTAAPNVEKGGWNRLMVEAVGSHFRLFVNDVQQAEVDDSTRTSGVSGVMIEIDNAGETIRGQFDDFEVRVPAQ